MKIADFNCAEQCQEPDFEIFDAQGEQKLLPAGPSIGEVDGVGGHSTRTLDRLYPTVKVCAVSFRLCLSVKNQYHKDAQRFLMS